MLNPFLFNGAFPNTGYKNVNCYGDYKYQLNNIYSVFREYISTHLQMHIHQMFCWWTNKGDEIGGAYSTQMQQVECIQYASRKLERKYQF